MASESDPWARSAPGAHTSADDGLSLDHIPDFKATPEQEDHVRRVVAGHDGVDAAGARTILEALGLVEPLTPTLTKRERRAARERERKRDRARRARGAEGPAA